jgi:hypothetical protein
MRSNGGTSWLGLCREQVAGLGGALRMRGLLDVLKGRAVSD